MDVAKHEKTSDFWRRLTEARRERRPPLSMRQEDVGKVVGVRQSAVTKWKRGESLPTLENAITIAVEAGVCVEWLLTGRGLKRPMLPDEDPATIALLDTWSYLKGEARTSLLGKATLARTIQNTASPERNREAHQQIVAASERLRDPTKTARRAG